MLICGRCPERRCQRDFTGRDSALAWLDAERPSLIAAVTMAASTGRDEIAMLAAARAGRVLGLAAAVR